MRDISCQFVSMGVARVGYLGCKTGSAKEMEVKEGCGPWE